MVFLMKHIYWWVLELLQEKVSSFRQSSSWDQKLLIRAKAGLLQPEFHFSLKDSPLYSPFEMFQLGWKQTSRTLILQSGHFNNQFLVYQPSMKTYRFVLPSPNTPCQNWRLEPKNHSTFQRTSSEPSTSMALGSVEKRRSFSQGM